MLLTEIREMLNAFVDVKFDVGVTELARDSPRCPSNQELYSLRCKIEITLKMETRLPKRQTIEPSSMDC